MSQLSKEFLGDTVSNNRFLKGNEKYEKMIAQTKEMLSNELTERNASSRHQKQIYVFPVGKRVSQNYIATFVSKIFFAFVSFLNIYFFVRFDLAENDWSTMGLPKAISDRYWFIFRY